MDYRCDYHFYPAFCLDFESLVVDERNQGENRPPSGFRGCLWQWLNYGYVEGLLAGDGEAQDVYALANVPAFQRPLKNFAGVLIAIVHRRDDVEDKWVATTSGERFTAEEILERVNFLERYFDSWVELVGE